MGDWIESQIEKQIVIANVSENRLCFLQKDGEDRLTDLMGKWAYYMGTVKIGPEDLTALCNYIKNSYPEMTLEEIDLCIEYSTKNKLDLDSDRFPSFSPSYASLVISSFLRLRNKTMINVLEKRSVANRAALRAEAAKPENQCFNMKDAIRQAYEQCNTAGEITDFFNVIYNFLRRTNRLVVPSEKAVDSALTFILTKSNVDAAMEYGRSMVNKSPDSRKSIKSILDGDKDTTVQRYARNYCVMLYIKAVPLDMLLSDIKVSEFDNR